MMVGMTEKIHDERLMQDLQLSDMRKTLRNQGLDILPVAKSDKGKQIY